MTLRGHRVMHTLIRAKFSPARTGYRYVYTGCSTGSLYGLFFLVNFLIFLFSQPIRECTWFPIHDLRAYSRMLLVFVVTAESSDHRN